MQKFKHVVILSYKFPPHSHVGGRRAYYFAKYLAKNGYNVTVITSDKKVKKNWVWKTDLSFVKIIKLESIKTPKEYNFKSKLFSKLYWGLCNKGRFLERIAWKIGMLFLPLDFNERLDFNEKKISNQLTPVDFVIASGGPWQMFEYGVRLNRELKSKLILDYRDPWADITGVGLNSLTNHGYFHSIISSKLLKLEKTILSESDLVITVSKKILENIGVISQSGIKKALIENGFDKSEFFIKNKKHSTFNLLYCGNLRKEQNVELFIRAISSLKINIQFNYYGDSTLINKSDNNRINIHNFVTKDKLNEVINETDLLVHFSYGVVKGIPSSKLYQYFGMKRPILLISNTNDIMEELVLKTKTGVICKTEDSIRNYLQKGYEEWQKTGSVTYQIDQAETEKYSYENQVKKLAKCLDEL